MAFNNVNQRRRYPLEGMFGTLAKKGGSEAAFIDHIVMACRSGYFVREERGRHERDHEEDRGRARREGAALIAKIETSTGREVGATTYDMLLWLLEEAGAPDSLQFTRAAVNLADCLDAAERHVWFTFDTESTFPDSPRQPVHGRGRVALIQIFDPIRDMVALIRVDEMSAIQLEEIEDALTVLGREKTFIHYGEEPLLTTLGVNRLDIQRREAIRYPNGGRGWQLVGLQRACGEIDVEVDKSETLSDWTRPLLRPAQIRYAVQDVVALYDLYRREVPR